LLIMKIMERSIERGLEECDFMKGDEQYKSDWTTESKANLKIKLVNKKFGSNLCNWGIRIAKETKMEKFLGRFLQ